jgi:hypothetical protein
VRELAAGRIPVAVACRVLKLARQPYYRWLQRPVSEAEFEQDHRANVLFDAHRDDPEFGYRFLVDEARSTGAGMAGRTAWRICRDNRWWSVFGKKRGRTKKASPPVHDDLVRRDFTAKTTPDRCCNDWLNSSSPETVIWLHYVRTAQVLGFFLSEIARTGEALREAPDTAEALSALPLDPATLVAGPLTDTDTLADVVGPVLQ